MLQGTSESQTWIFKKVPEGGAWIRDIVDKVGASDANWNGY